MVAQPGNEEECPALPLVQRSDHRKPWFALPLAHRTALGFPARNNKAWASGFTETWMLHCILEVWALCCIESHEAVHHVE